MEMITLKKISLLSMAMALSISGCGSDSDSNRNDGYGGGAKLTEQFVRSTIGDITASSSVTVQESDTLPDMTNENANYWDCNSIGGLCAYEPSNGVAQEDGLKRYSISADDLAINSIPVYYWNEDGSDRKDPRFMYAMEQIQKIILPKGKVSDIFDIRGMADIPTVEFWSPDYSNLPTEGGIIFSVGTAGNHGNVGVAPHSQQIYNSMIDHNNIILGDKGWVWLNLDNPEGTKIASNEVAVHEFAHIFFAGHMENRYDDGKGNSYTVTDGHFDGFGIHGAFDERAEAVLRAMYTNPAGTTKENLVIQL